MRKPRTKAGEVELRIPKLRTQTFETAIIERYRRLESSVEEALIEMHMAGITEALWGTRVSPSTVSAAIIFSFINGIASKRLSTVLRKRLQFVSLLGPTYV